MSCAFGAAPAVYLDRSIAVKIEKVHVHYRDPLDFCFIPHLIRHGFAVPPPSRREAKLALLLNEPGKTKAPSPRERSPKVTEGVVLPVKRRNDRKVKSYEL